MPTIGRMAKIVLDLDRKDVSAEDFAEGFLSQIRLVREVMAEMGVPANEVRWVIDELRSGSAYAASSAHIQGGHLSMADIESAIRYAGEGTQQLGVSAKSPILFSEAALKTSRTLIRILSENGGKAQAKFGKVTVRPNPKVAENVATILRGDLRSITSVDGILVGVNTGHGHFEIAVNDRLRSRRIHCNIRDDVLPRALQAFGKRVVVRGLMWSRRDGSAIRIDVRDMDVMPPDDTLPTRQDVRGILGGFRLANGD